MSQQPCNPVCFVSAAISDFRVAFSSPVRVCFLRIVPVAEDRLKRRRPADRRCPSSLVTPFVSSQQLSQHFLCPKVQNQKSITGCGDGGKM
ncbi:unnamed protein product [Lactuca virosa]|uniref:Uncharacterized protein n=1 Tax=Lactuca virosa TaxID=75947 RepID=A0AAU9NV97_9ASTR|nr:unnamed protein product [Lactuca virosa]